MAERRRRPTRRRSIDQPRLLSFQALRRINGEGAYANLVTQELTSGLEARDAGFIIELVHGTCRWQGSYDRIIERASGRGMGSLQPAVIDILRLACHQLFGMRIPVHAAVAASVDLAGVAIGERVTGLVNAIVRKMAAHDLDGWLDELAGAAGDSAALGLRHAHPEWVVDGLRDALASDETELAELLAANNASPVPMLAVRPGLATVDELVAAGAQAASHSPWGASRPGNPSSVPAVAEGRAGVQDEGSQLVIRAATNAELPAGAWLDLCAGPGGKSALLRGVAPGLLVANEFQPHRAQLVRHSLRAYPPAGASGRAHQVLIADGARPAWRPESFSLVVADVPCSGLGALRRRPESRWRREPHVVEELVDLQSDLLASAIASTMPGGVVAYITCSPLRAETVDIVANAQQVQIMDAPTLLPGVPRVASRLDTRFIQLWPHIHHTDAMFCALLRRL